MKNKEIICFIGKIGAGKSTVSTNYILDKKSSGYSIYYTAFADEIKRDLRNYFGLGKHGKIGNSKLLSYTEVKNILSKTLWWAQGVWVESNISPFYESYDNCIVNEDYNLNFRNLMNIYGTDIGRNSHRNVWAEKAIEKIKYVIPNCDIVVIDDLRFLNEYDCVNIFCKENKIKFHLVGVYVSDDLKDNIIVRAQRRNITVHEMQKMEKHSTESEIDQLLLLATEHIINK